MRFAIPDGRARGSGIDSLDFIERNVISEFLRGDLGRGHDCRKTNAPGPCGPGALDFSVNRLGEEFGDSFGLHEFAGLVEVVVHDRLGIAAEGVVEDRREEFLRCTGASAGLEPVLSDLPWTLPRLLHAPAVIAG